MNIIVRPLEDHMVRRGGSVNPSKYVNETFDLLSIPGFDKGAPEVLEGRGIGSSKQCVEPNDVLLSKIVPHIRRCWVVPENRGLRQIASGEWIIFRNRDWCPEYAKHFLTSDIFHRKFMNTVAGIGGSLVRARPAFVAKIPIPLPPLEEQRRIVEILDAAQGLIDQRKEQIALMDQLVQSLFYDMFGDPVSNPMGWDEYELETLVAQRPQNGMYKPASFYVSEPNGTPILRIDAFYDGKIVNKKFKRLICDIKELEKYGLRVNDIVINRVNSIEYLGKCALIDKLTEPTVYESNMMRFNVDSERVNAFYLSRLLSQKSTYKQILNRAKKAVNQASVNQKDVSSLIVLLPPITLQTEFANRVQKIETQKAAMCASLSELENTFNALMQKAFKGELSL